MRFTINISISKTHARILSALLFMLIVGISADYVFSTGGLAQWHPLSEISADGGATSIDSTLNIPSKGNVTITGNLSITGGNVGIGTTSPGAKLEVAGQVKITGGTPGADKVLTSDANGLASWQVLSGQAITPLGYPLYHTAGDCTTAGGTVAPADGTITVCRFNAANCPGSWTPYKKWSITQFNTCGGGYCGWAYCPDSCTTANHTWSDADIESCAYITLCGYPGPRCGTCYATRTQIGCY